MYSITLYHFKYSHIKSLTLVSHQKLWVSGGNFHPYAEIPLKGNSTHLSVKKRSWFVYKAYIFYDIYYKTRQ